MTAPDYHLRLANPPHPASSVGFTYLPNCDISVRVMDSRHAAIGVDVDVWLLLDGAEVDVLRFVRDAEFFQDDKDFQWVWTLVTPC